MKINWKVRLQNKPVLMAILGGIIGLVYQILGIVGIVPSISEDEVVNLIGMFVNMLVLIGVVVDPTTEGICDSDCAMGYEKPKAKETESVGE
ncbi:MAG: phage holin [Lachnospiraceae bacterium]|nr:phage holin [Lachnospiraceae bacterium]